MTSILMTILMGIDMQACSYFNLSGGKHIKGSDNYVTKEIRTDNFREINICGSFNMTYIQKPGSPKVEVHAPDNIVGLLNIHVKDNTLYVGFKKGYNISYEKLEVRITSPDLNNIIVAGSGDIDLANGLKTTDFKISIAGSGDIRSPRAIDCENICTISIAGSGDIDADTLRCGQLAVSVAGSGDMVIRNATTISASASVAGSGTITIAGSVDKAEYNVAGSGDLDVSRFRARSVSAHVSGSGDIRCHATEYLKASTTGSGCIGYKGNPQLDVERKGIYKL